MSLKLSLHRARPDGLSAARASSARNIRGFRSKHSTDTKSRDEDEELLGCNASDQKLVLTELGEDSFSDLARTVDFDEPEGGKGNPKRCSSKSKVPNKAEAKSPPRRSRNSKASQETVSPSSTHMSNEEFNASFSNFDASMSGHFGEIDRGSLALDTNRNNVRGSDILGLPKQVLRNVSQQITPRAKNLLDQFKPQPQAVLFDSHSNLTYESGNGQSRPRLSDSKQFSASEDIEEETESSEFDRDDVNAEPEVDQNVEVRRTENDVLALIKADMERKEAMRKSTEPSSSTKSRRKLRRSKSSDDPPSPRESRNEEESPDSSARRCRRSKSADVDGGPRRKQESSGRSQTQSRGRVSARTSTRGSGRSKSRRARTSHRRARGSSRTRASRSETEVA